MTKKPIIGKNMVVVVILLTGTLAITALSSTQQVLADKVGPAGDDINKQGGLGEFLSREGQRDYGYSSDENNLGERLSTFAKKDTTGGTCDPSKDFQCSHETFGVRNLGDNFAYYASGECHNKETNKCE